MCSFVTPRDREKRYQSMVVATWIAVDDVTCRLQEVGSHALSALAAPMAQAVALTAPATLGLFGVSFHEPFHADGGTTVHSGNRAQWAAPGAVTPQLDMVRQDRPRARTSPDPSWTISPGQAILNAKATASTADFPWTGTDGVAVAACCHGDTPGNTDKIS